MVLVIDSGSTKSDWMLLENKLVTRQFSTMGFNPFFHDEEVISSAIRENADLYAVADDIKQIFYYGAGCSNEALCAVVQGALEIVFKQSDISVNHDLAACAYACYADTPAISCILGTGSNSCYFDGNNIEEAVPAVGYILGDEGSGSYYGKQLLRDFLYHNLPKQIEADFIKEFNLNKGRIFEKVYRRPNANVYLASFMKFIAERKEEPYFKDMMIEGMSDFLSAHVTCYDNYKNLPVNFIGSVAFYFKDELQIAAEKLGINLGQVIRKPITGLVDYHVKQGHLD